MTPNRLTALMPLLMVAWPQVLHASGPASEERTTCKTIGLFHACVRVTVSVADWGAPDGVVFYAVLHGGPLDAPFLPSAIGFYAKDDPGFASTAFTAPGGWGNPAPVRWTLNPFSREVSFPGLGEYTLFAASTAVRDEQRWAAILEGQAGDLHVWNWAGALPPDFLFVWRGESADGKIDFDCFQDPAGGSECLITSTPEPVTVILVLTGMTFLVAVSRGHSRHRDVEDRAA